LTDGQHFVDLPSRGSGVRGMAKKGKKGKKKGSKGTKKK
jgi:hypothetical protein